jgi:hypothetical protein
VADRVVFLRPDAERIARAVRTVEAGNRNETPLTFRRIVESSKGDKVFRTCTFTGVWSKNTPKVVTFRNQTSTPNTLSAINILSQIPADCGSGTAERTVLVAKEGTSWYYVAHERNCATQFPARELDDAADCNSSALQVQNGSGPDVLFNDQGCAKWVQLSRIEVVTDVSWNNGIFVQKEYIWAFADPGQGNGAQIVSATPCP